MKQFITKDIDYTGCHPDIANALRQGKAIKIRIISDHFTPYCEDVIGYDKDSDYPYLLGGGCAVRYFDTVCKNRKRILKDHVSIMKILVEEGWVYEFKDRVWRNGFNLFHRWDSCGREVDNYPDNFYTYEEE